MYVCVCNAVTDRAIREVVDRGAQSLFEVQCHLPVGACCGRCEVAATDVVNEQVRFRTRKNAA
ncbi:MAG: (2Fe-2S)-binding protein [Gammaproteobacteria bacterium]